MNIAYGSTVSIKVGLESTFDGALFGRGVAVRTSCVYLVLRIACGTAGVAAVVCIGLCLDAIGNGDDRVDQGSSGVDAGGWLYVISMRECMRLKALELFSFDCNSPMFWPLWAHHFQSTRLSSAPLFIAGSKSSRLSVL